MIIAITIISTLILISGAFLGYIYECTEPKK